MNEIGDTISVNTVLYGKDDYFISYIEDYVEPTYIASLISSNKKLEIRITLDSCFEKYNIIRTLLVEKKYV